jgi:hypothetical protein
MHEKDITIGLPSRIRVSRTTAAAWLPGTAPVAALGFHAIS